MNHFDILIEINKHNFVIHNSDDSDVGDIVMLVTL